MSFGVFIRPIAIRSANTAKAKSTRSGTRSPGGSGPPRALTSRRLFPAAQVSWIECRLIGRDNVRALYKQPQESDFEVAGWPEWKEGRLGEPPKVRAVQEELAFLRLYCPSKGPFKMSISVELEACESSFPAVLAGRTMLGHASENLFDAYRTLVDGDQNVDRSKAVERWLKLVRHYRYDPLMFREVEDRGYANDGHARQADFDCDSNMSVIPEEVGSDLRRKLESDPLPFDKELFRPIEFKMVSERVVNRRCHVRYQTEIEIGGPEDGSLVIGWDSGGEFRPIPLFRDQSLGGIPVHALKVALTDVAALDTQILSGVDVYRDTAELLDESDDAPIEGKGSAVRSGTTQLRKIESGVSVVRSHRVLPRRLPDGKFGGHLQTSRLSSKRMKAWMSGLRNLYPAHDVVHLLPLEEYSRCGGTPLASSMRLEADGRRSRLGFELEYPYSGFRYQYDQVSNRLDPSLGTGHSYRKFIRELSRQGWRVMLDVHVSKVAAAGYTIYATPKQSVIYDAILANAGLQRPVKNGGGAGEGVYLDLYRDRLQFHPDKVSSVQEIPAYALFFLRRVPGGQAWDPATRPDKLSEIGRTPLVRSPGQRDWGFSELNIADPRVAAIRLLMLVEQFRSLYTDVSTGVGVRLDCHHVSPDQYQRHAFTGLLMNLLRRLFRDRGGILSMAEVVAEDPTRHGHQTSTDIVQPLSFLQVIGRPEGLEMPRGVEGRYEHYLANQILVVRWTPSFTVGTSNHDSPAAIEPQGADNAIRQASLTLGKSGELGSLWNAISHDTYLALRPGTVMLEVVGDSYGATRHHNPKGEPCNGCADAGLIRFDQENLVREAIWSHSLPQRRGFLKRWLGRHLRPENSRRICLNFWLDGALVGDFFLCPQTGIGRLLLRNLRNERYPIEFDWAEVIRDPEDLQLLRTQLEDGALRGAKLFEVFNHSTVVKSSTISPWLEEATGRWQGQPISEGFKMSEIKPWEVMVFLFAKPKQESIQDLEMNIARTVPLGRLAALHEEGIPRNGQGKRLAVANEAQLRRSVKNGPRDEGAAFAKLKKMVECCFTRENHELEMHGEV